MEFSKINMPKTCSMSLISNCKNFNGYIFSHSSVMSWNTEGLKKIYKVSYTKIIHSYFQQDQIYEYTILKEHFLQDKKGNIKDRVYLRS